ncbi:unnamed protein product [Symbiodinium sp. CCMP2592]|nr:unnamed protein product [Symbiodinium sp. CCMP2592]
MNIRAFRRKRLLAYAVWMYSMEKTFCFLGPGGYPLASPSVVPDVPNSSPNTLPPGDVDVPRIVFAAFEYSVAPYRNKLKRIVEELGVRKDQAPDEQMKSAFSRIDSQLGGVIAQWDRFIEQCKTYAIKAVDSPEGRTFVLESWHMRHLEDFEDEVDQLYEDWKNDSLAEWLRKIDSI